VVGSSTIRIKTPGPVSLTNVFVRHLTLQIQCLFKLFLCVFKEWRGASHKCPKLQRRTLHFHCYYTAFKICAKELYLRNSKLDRNTRQNKYNYVLIPQKKTKFLYLQHAHRVPQKYAHVQHWYYVRFEISTTKWRKQVLTNRKIAKFLPDYTMSNPRIQYASSKL